jgi:hypothetical protein
MQRNWRLLWYAPVLLATILSGCGPGHGMTLGRVQGKVNYKGEPLKFGTVSFVPDISKGTNGPIATGNIKSDGTYILSTDEGGDGALVGHHKVSIVGLDPAPINPNDKPMPTPQESPLEFLKSRGKATQPTRPRTKAAAEQQGQVETFTDRGGRVYRYVVPKKLGVPEESGLAVEVTRGSNTVNFDIAEDGTAHIAK